ncbi:hypothetical protein SK128_013289 [Halocaridina rubra]|uniref:CUB domain-containing protein n=1 Tax=Halocaridina rubra TaxID=373956 RepID=A0AAN9A9Y2_HALRR
MNGLLNYENNLFCQWIIEVNQGQGINFHFNSFDLEGSSPSCRYDYVIITDLNLNQTLHRDRLCGSSIPNDMLSWTNRVSVVFRTDLSIVRTGFNLTYTAAAPSTGTIQPPTTTMNVSTTTPTPPEPSCLPQTNLTNNMGNIIVPINGASSYENNQFCRWIIEVDQGQGLNFHFNSFDLEGSSPSCRYDYVIITDLILNQTLHRDRLCGSSIPNDMLSWTNRVSIVFRTDISVVRAGFNLTYTAAAPSTAIIPPQTDSTTRYRTTMGLNTSSSAPPEQSCLPETNLTSDMGNIIVPINGASNYQNNQLCRWVIEVNQGQGVNFHFNSFDLEGNSPSCPFDYVIITDLNLNQTLHRDRLCGSSIPNDMLSWTNRVSIVFRTDISVVRAGFNLTYTAAAPSTAIIPAQTDSTTRYRTTMGLNTSSSAPPEQSCLPETNLTSDMGNIIVPINGASNYQNNQLCRWVIEVNQGQGVNFHFNSFDLEGNSPSCPFDYVIITDLNLNQTLHRDRLCGASIPDDMLSWTNRVSVVFRSDGSVVGTGFNLSYSSAAPSTDFMQTSTVTATTSTLPSCLPLTNLTSDNGTISVPIYGEALYKNYLHCEWVIEVSLGYVANIIFTHLDLEGTYPSCSFDAIFITDGYTNQQLHEGGICGSSLPNVSLTSSSNRVRIVFDTDGSVVRSGFSLNYVAVLPEANTTSLTGLFTTTTVPRRRKNDATKDLGDTKTVKTEMPKVTKMALENKKKLKTTPKTNKVQEKIEKKMEYIKEALQKPLK